MVDFQDFWILKTLKSWYYEQLENLEILKFEFPIAWILKPWTLKNLENPENFENLDMLKSLNVEILKHGNLEF